ncbi:DUF1801 domain-containing protein [Undibacterium parvum]|uniref:DUF1801 domain-containing protein n=2 Tax=Undibacterium TaxID=401469 RepID=A0A6M4A212_9BURK|nr:DUF1801 domain-containing protein [Undibacterium parvum]AZP10812.1 DUF1801 domain-containing protein [Undibacterium parvum]QJQ05406.1 DUF1801 domain-containing protein [Undibacterium piscinae]
MAASKNPTLSSFEAVFALASEEQRPIVEALHQKILSVHPGAYMLAWPKQGIVSYGFGPRKMLDHYAYIGIQAKHTNLGFYRGTSLSDPAVLLEGTGKSLRHVKISTLAQVASPSVLALLKNAIAAQSTHAKSEA